MAVLVLKDGTKRELTPERALKLWNGLQEPSSMDEAQQDYIATIDRLYLNWRHAPDSYVQEYLDQIIPFALQEWTVDRQGRVLKPGTGFAWDFARRWGLWLYGAPTSLVSAHAIVASSAFPAPSPVDYSEATHAD